MPMREGCKHFQSRSYDTGEVVRFCELDLAPEAPWRCPDDCASYRAAHGGRRLAAREPGASPPSRTSPARVAPTSCDCSKRRPTSSTPSCPRPWPRWSEEEQRQRARPAVVEAPLTCSGDATPSR